MLTIINLPCLNIIYFMDSITHMKRKFIQRWEKILETDHARRGCYSTIHKRNLL